MQQLNMCICRWGNDHVSSDLVILKTARPLDLKVVSLHACLVPPTADKQIEVSAPTGITAFARAQGTGTNTYQLAASTGSQDLNVGSNWVGGLIWASPTGNANNGQVI